MIIEKVLKEEEMLAIWATKFKIISRLVFDKKITIGVE